MKFLHSTEHTNQACTIASFSMTSLNSCQCIFGHYALVELVVRGTGSVPLTATPSCRLALRLPNCSARFLKVEGASNPRAEAT